MQDNNIVCGKRVKKLCVCDLKSDSLLIGVTIFSSLLSIFFILILSLNNYFFHVLCLCDRQLIIIYMNKIYLLYRYISNKDYDIIEVKN